MLLSVTEGEDKPLKYPPMFQSADVVIISKIDLAQACAFDRKAAWRISGERSPRRGFSKASAKTGQGMDAWREFLLQHQKERKTRDPPGG